MTAEPNAWDNSLTLEPPGRVAVIGCNSLGLETALYARYLGYDAVLLDSQGFQTDYAAHGQDPLPVLPGDALSKLARSALQAQRGQDTPVALPTNTAQWIDDEVAPLAQVDLLRGRVHDDVAIERIRVVDVPSSETPQDSSEMVDDDDIPPDFLIQVAGETSFQPFEAVIVVQDPFKLRTPVEQQQLSFELPADYFFWLASDGDQPIELRLRTRYQQITRVFAQLAGREDLDLYRPLRS